MKYQHPKKNKKLVILRTALNRVNNNVVYAV